jgi:hypothetical protein
MMVIKTVVNIHIFFSAANLLPYSHNLCQVNSHIEHVPELQCVFHVAVTVKVCVQQVVSSDLLPAAG